VARAPLRVASTPEEMAAANASRPSWRVRRVAADLDCDATQVRRLVYSGQLEAHRIGKRGIRVYLDSLKAYKEARSLGRPVLPRPAPRAIATPGYLEAMAYLRKRGMKV